MAWTAPVTWADSVLVTAADLNQQVRDNLLYLKSKPSASVYNNANISIPNGVVTALTFNTERFDTGAFHSTSVNTGRLTAPETGVYLFGGGVSFAANATGLRAVGVRANGTTVVTVEQSAAPAAGSFEITFSRIYQLTAGDYIELTTYQTSGGALNMLFVANSSPEFWIVGPL